MADAAWQKSLLRFITLFNAAINNYRFYSAGHPRTQQCLTDAYRLLSDLFRLKQQITLVLIENELVVDNAPLKSREGHLDKFITILKETGVERLTLCQGLSEQELADFVTQCVQSETGVVQGTPRIRIGKVGLAVAGDASTTAGPTDSSETETAAPVETDVQTALAARQNCFDELHHAIADIRGNKQIDFKGLGDMVERLAGAFSRGVSPLTMLASPEAVDDHTAAHMLNVSLLVTSQAAFLGFRGKVLRQIGMASLLSDVGKLLVPSELITKPSALTPKEKKIIESHTVKGARYILGLKHMPGLAVLCALEHHRRYDGSGYPALAANWEPGIVSQMVAIADAYAAMSSPRPYRPARPQNKIVYILKNESGTAYNPLLVERFFRIVSPSMHAVESSGPITGAEGKQL